MRKTLILLCISYLSIYAQQVIVVEEVNMYGGYASLISKFALELAPGKYNFWKVLSVKDEFAKVVGNMRFQRKQMGVGHKAIVECALNALA